MRIQQMQIHLSMKDAWQFLYRCYLCVHDKWSILNNRLLNRLASNEQEPQPCLIIGGGSHMVSWPKNQSMLPVGLGSANPAAAVTDICKAVPSWRNLHQQLVLLMQPINNGKQCNHGHAITDMCKAVPSWRNLHQQLVLLTQRINNGKQCNHGHAITGHMQSPSKLEEPAVARCTDHHQSFAFVITTEKNMLPVGCCPADSAAATTDTRNAAISWRNLQ